MTNAEKFKAVFGIDFQDMDVSMLNRRYRKMKPYGYRVIDDPHSRGRKEIDRGIVFAGSKKAAREQIIEDMGSDYLRYQGSEWPAYAILIEEVEEVEEK